MADGSSALTDAQRANFNALTARFGQQPGAGAQAPLDTANFGGNLVISSDPKESRVAPVLVPFTSMAQLKSMIGVPDEHFASGKHSDAHVQYPAALAPDRAALLQGTKNKADLRAKLTPDEHRTLRQAAEAYVQGHSAKVAHFEPLLDAHFAPGELALITAPSLTIQDGQQLTVQPSGMPVVLNFGTVTTHGTGQIVVNGAPVMLCAQVFTAEGDPPHIVINIANGTNGIDGPAGVVGAAGFPANPGASTGPDKNGNYTCTAQPSDGGSGAPGGAGGNGTAGGAAPNGPPATFYYATVIGQLTITTEGGNGGSGGSGGQGGGGGQGGAAATVAQGCGGTANAGPPGVGGQGGNGGNGGPGGNGSMIVIYANFGPGGGVTKVNNGGHGGAGGQGGIPGPGSGNPPAGSPGQTGQAGAPPVITVRPYVPPPGT